MAYGCMEGNNIPYQIFQSLLNSFIVNQFTTIIMLQTPNQGATPIIYAAVSKDIEEKGGIHISNCKETSVPPLALDEEVQERLFKLSLKQVHLKDFFQYL